MPHPILTLIPALLGLGAPAAPGVPSSDPAAVGAGAPRGTGGVLIQWDRRAVEHLWNRAGFGIPEGEIERWVEAGPEALVDHLLAPRPLTGQLLTEPYTFKPAPIDPVEFEQTPLMERRKFRKQTRDENRIAFRELRATWLNQILRTEDPLRDRMCLFWHGVFTSSYADVRHPVPMIEQHNTLRDGALGSYAELLRSMLQDPAMLVYLNNNQNRKGKPNENLAREVMELFSLGEGNYTEADVQEAARALTGASVKTIRNVARYRFFDKRHDQGEKTILGVAGEHGPDELATILLDQDACPRFIARSIIEYLEGVSADDERVERYAAQLRETGYDVAFMLKKLFLDPDFYRADAVGARVSSPLDYLVGTAVRLDLEVPPTVLADGAAQLGQDLFRPPNVKGWDEGMAWISTATFMLRGNFAGAILGLVDSDGMRAEAMEFAMEMEAEGGEMASMSGAEMKAMAKEQLRRDELSSFARDLSRGGYEMEVSLAEGVQGLGASSDEEVAVALLDLLLAIEAPPETRALIQQRVTAAREEADVKEGSLVQSPRRSEAILRDLAHFVLSLPEAQLH